MAGGEQSGAGVRETALALGVRWVERVEDAWLDASLLSGLPVEWARAHRVLPVRGPEGLWVLTADPEDPAPAAQVALVLGRDLEPVACAAGALLEAIDRCYLQRDHGAQVVVARTAPTERMGAPASAGEAGERGPAGVSVDDLLQVSEQSPVTQLINVILLEALKKGASDVHFEPQDDRLRVRYRIDGVLFEQPAPVRNVTDAVVSRLKVMGRMDIAERRLPQDGMARVRLGGREIDIRVSTVPVADGERVVLRLLNRDAALLPLSALGLGNSVVSAFAELLALRSGLVIVAGPTGSGKTTTLYAALSRLDATRTNILTIEDPIEYQLPSIGQIQVKPKIGLTFAAGLRHILRQDPDVILVGETRDLETAEIAMRASMTGHLVFTTLHTNDAPGAVPRLLDMGAPGYLLAATLRGALAQRLVRRLCPACRTQRAPAPADLALLERWMPGAAQPDAVWTARGCAECLEGYTGRVGVFELMVVDRAIADAIRNAEAERRDFGRLVRERGMRGLMADAVDKALQGVTTFDEIVNLGIDAAL